MKNELQQAIKLFLASRTKDGRVDCTPDELREFVVTISVQSFIRGSGVKIAVDGIWGKHTETEFSKLD